jgi:hypothetical protein
MGGSGAAPGGQGPRNPDGSLVPDTEKAFKSDGGPKGPNSIGNTLLSKAVDLESDLNNGFLTANADGSPIKDERSGKGPTNPVTKQREPVKKGLKNPFGSTSPDPDFDFQVGFSPQEVINDSDNFANAAAASQTNPSQGASNALFDNVRSTLPSDEEVGALAAGSGLASGDKDGDVGQL